MNAVADQIAQYRERLEALKQEAIDGGLPRTARAYSNALLLLDTCLDGGKANEAIAAERAAEEE